jgi:L,D-peptidoglycan transpeptidase YkuD (ErfK/YbiS/YcfS/YnhG family)
MLDDVIIVRPDGAYPAAIIEFGGSAFAGVVGRSGVTTSKAEGDWATPVGQFALRTVYYRPDRLSEPQTALATQPMDQDDIWIEDPASPDYNTPAKAQTGYVGDRLWREDHLYDIVVDIDFNRRSPVAGAGSAIFLHVARNQEQPGLTPSAGCVTMAKHDLLELLSMVPADVVISIESE